jgi:glycosyltransferase involved in cell wall biosynthesis
MSRYFVNSPASGVLTIMFSTTGSIAAYKRQGSYSAFVARLQIYARHFAKVHICTFDTKNYSDELGIANVFHHPMPNLPAISVFYHVLSPLIHRRILSDTTVIRTFNITGAIPGVILRFFTKAPVFVSYGYSLPGFILFEHGRLKYWLYRFVEKIALTLGDYIITATPNQFKTVGAEYGEHKMVLIPNFVDSDRFAPPNEPRSDYLLFVGRLSPQKNLDVFLKALAQAGLNRPLKIVGQGELEIPLRQLVGELDLQVEFTGTLSNEVLPALYASAWAFVLPSLFEGMPKVLIEAMACAAPCLGTNVEGIRDLIVDGETGLLVQPTVAGLSAGLQRLEDDDLRAHIGQQARCFIEEKFSMRQILAEEIAYLQGGH